MNSPAQLKLLVLFESGSIWAKTAFPCISPTTAPLRTLRPALQTSFVPLKHPRSQELVWGNLVWGWSALHCDRSSCAQNAQMMIPPFWFNAASPGRCLIVLTGFVQWCNACHKQRRAFFPFQVFFVGATSLVLHNIYPDFACFTFAA